MRIVLALAFCLWFPTLPAAAQTTTYVSGSNGTIDENTTCSNPLVRTFSVATTGTVSDVDVGVYAAHSHRGGLRITLQSPAGTRVQMVNDNFWGVTGSNFNVRLDDDGTQLVNTDGSGSDHSTAHPPPFQHTFVPNAPLSAFAGQPSNGTWRLEICNIGLSLFGYFLGGTGTFQHAELYLTTIPTNQADLSLNKTVSSSNPTSGASISYTLTVTSAASSSVSAAGVTVTDLLPAGVAYTGHTGFGTYDPGTGLWTVGTLTPGQSRSLTLNATVTASAGATIRNAAEVASSSVADPDSAPGNGAPGEDDFDDASFTVSGARVAGTPPALTCPKGTILFDWDNRAWPATTTSNAFAVTGLGTVAFTISNPGAWMNVFNGVNPRETTTVTGGLSPAQSSLAEGIDFASRTQVATTQIALPLPVDGLQFRIFDVDYYGGQFADRVRVSGMFGGTPVTPVLTNGVANYVIGNEAFGDALSADGSADGTVTVTFQSAVDTVIIEYGNHSLAPADPGGQAITIHDITLCEPHAEISVTKISSLISDPLRGGTNPVAIPGALLSYCVLIGNSGSATATGVSATDALPAGLSFVRGSMRSGSSCAAATTVEDDNASGSDESDPAGASVAGNQLTFRAGTLAMSQSRAFTFSVTIQ